jgi:hypothetical protein
LQCRRIADLIWIDITEKSNSNISPLAEKVSPSSDTIITPNTRILLLFVLIIILAGGSSAFWAPGHWMEGPAVAIMMVFMPLTAVSYLHFRLPKKQDEYRAVKKALHTDSENSEVFSVIFDQEDSSADYLLPIFYVSFFSMLGFYILFTNHALVLFNGMEWITQAVSVELRQGNTGDVKLLDFSESSGYRRGVVAIGTAFLGSYIWSIQYIFRRMMTLDLPPGAYYSVGERMVYSAFLAVVIQHFIINSGGKDMGMLDRQIIAISFLVGIFPERALSWMKESLGSIFSNKSNAANPLPLEMLERISGFHKARLLDLGIDNVQNLAQASLMELIVKTPFRPRVLIDWMAQARLCLEFKDKVGKIREAGIRTILDLQEIADDEEMLMFVAKNAQLDLEYIKIVCRTNSDEKAIDRLRDAYDKLNVI